MYIVGLNIPKDFTSNQDTVGYKYLEYVYATLTLRSVDNILGTKTFVPQDLLDLLYDDVSAKIISWYKPNLSYDTVVTLLQVNYHYQTQFKYKGLPIEKVLNDTLISIIDELDELPTIGEIDELIESEAFKNRTVLCKEYLEELFNKTELVSLALNDSRNALQDALMR